MAKSYGNKMGSKANTSGKSVAGKNSSGFGLGEPKVPMGRNMDVPIAGQPKKSK